MAEDKDKKEESQKDTAENKDKKEISTKSEDKKEDSKDKKKDSDEDLSGCGWGCFIAIIIIVVGAFFLFRSCSRQSSDDSSSQDKTEQSQSSSQSDSDDDDDSADESSSSESEEEAQKKADKVSDLVVSDINAFKKKFASSNDDAYSWSAFVKGVSFNSNGSADITMVPEFSELSNGQRFEVANHINNEVAAAADHYNALDDDEDAADGVFLTFYVDKTRIGRSKVLDKKTYKWFDN